MKILVTFALENEFAPWRAIRDFRSGLWGKAEAYCAEIDGAEVGVVLTGVGPRVAALGAQHVLKSNGNSIQFCVSSGLAGAVKPQYAIGQVLAARVVRSEIPGGDRNTNLIECSAALLSFAESCGATIVNRFYTSERAIGTQEEKEHIGQLADAVDMESFGVISEAAAAGIPAIAIRAVSDLADENLPFDMNEVFTETGQVSIPRVLGQVARHPQSVPGLMKLGQHSKKAADALAQFLDRYVAAIAERTAALGARGAA
jgi:adenosylhomocysteine nucleosidase